MSSFEDEGEVISGLKETNEFPELQDTPKSVRLKKKR